MTSKNTPYSNIKFEENIEYVFDDETIDDILEHITLKVPKTSFLMYLEENYNEYKKENTNPNYSKFYKACTAKWGEMKDDEKEKYKEKLEEAKKRYKYEIEIVRHYLFKDYNEVIHCSPTAYNLFVNERMLEGFEKNLDPKEVRTKAAQDWKRMKPNEKEIYFQKKEDNDNFFEKAKHIKKVNGISMFVQKIVEMANKKNEEIPSVSEMKSSWKTLPIAIKNKFEKYAESINEERDKLRDIFELVNGVKPKKPVGAYKIFLQEKLKEFYQKSHLLSVFL